MNRLPSHTVRPGKSALRVARSPNRQDVFGGQNGSTISGAARDAAVINHVVHVLLVRFPDDVSFGGAPQMPAAAGMSSLVRRRRRWAVHDLTQERGQAASSTIDGHYRIAAAVSPVRPVQAFTAFIGEDNLSHELKGAAGERCAPGKWVAMTNKSVSVSATEANRMIGPRATVNGAGTCGQIRQS